MCVTAWLEALPDAGQERAKSLSEVQRAHQRLGAVSVTRNPVTGLAEREAYDSRELRLKYLLVLVADAAIVVASLYLLRPVQTCSGDPPQCSYHFGFARLAVLLTGIVLFLVVLALSSTDETTRKPSSAERS
jgi:hypothetical protein